MLKLDSFHQRGLIQKNSIQLRSPLLDWQLGFLDHDLIILQPVNKDNQGRHNQGDDGDDDAGHEAWQTWPE